MLDGPCFISLCLRITAALANQSAVPKHRFIRISDLSKIRNAVRTCGQVKSLRIERADCNVQREIIIFN